MGKTAAAAAVIIFIFSSGIVFAERINLITDQYWYQMIVKENSDNPVLAARQSVFELIPFIGNEDVFAGRKKVRTSVIEVGGRSVLYNQVAETVSTIKSGTVILSPLFSYVAAELAEKNPDKRIIAFSQLPQMQRAPPNCSFIRLSRAEAFSAAGKWAASQQESVFPLFFTGGSSGNAEKDAFSEGWKQVTAENPIDITILSNSDDTKTVDKWVGKVEKAEGCIAAVFAGPLTVTALDRLDGVNCRIISEYTALWSGSGYSEEAVIELSPVKILTETVIYCSAESYDDNKVIEAEFISPEF